MKKRLLSTLKFIGIGLTIAACSNHDNQQSEDLVKVQSLQKSYQEHLENSPFKETKNLTRTERKQLGLPPNAYNEQVFEMTMDPSTGRPMPERLMPIQEEMKANRILKRGTNVNSWKSRGPNNQGGRTRGIMFDPNDADNTRVFAGCVSGGLWVNEDITDANSSWTLVDGMPANVAVNVIISDPNNPQIFYIGAGESYTSGQGVGRGIWKSTNGGQTWTNIFGGYESVSNNNQIINGIFYINDIIARNNGGTTELYAGVASARYGSGRFPDQVHSYFDVGLYKSSNGGSTWNRFNITYENGIYKNPCDLELDINNNIWLTTTGNAFGDLGGDIYKSTDGVAFNLINSVPGVVRRTELEVSSSDPNRFWVAVEREDSADEDKRKADLYTTTDTFTSMNKMPEPNDLDSGIPADDYTRGQAFYDLVIEADGNDRLYVGGIDLFYSDNNGVSWSQISKWNDRGEFADYNRSLVHADQHAIVFRPGSSDNQIVFGTDGGVYYSDNIANANNSNNVIERRDNNYVTMQFYYGTVDISGSSDGDDIAGGSQDNGTQFLVNAQLEDTNPFSEEQGGDGAYTEIDEGGQYAITTFTYNSHFYVNYPQLTSRYIISTSSDNENNDLGSFINQAALDHNLDILYSNASNGSNYQIERVSNFQNGVSAIEREFLKNDLLDNRPSAFKVSPFTTTSTTLFVGMIDGNIVRIKNADTSSPIWSSLPTTNFIGSISDIEFGQSENQIFVTIHNYGVTSIWYSSNGGVSWRSLEGNLPDMPVKCILQNPLRPTELIIGTELGVWATTDFTATNVIWETSYNGMNDVTVLDLDLRPSDNLILATTFGRGMFTSNFTSTLGVEEEKSLSNLISVYPTISDGEINFKSKQDLGISNLNVFDINGKNVYTKEVEISPVGSKINLNIASGIYFVNINVDNYSETKKIIIK